MNGMDLLGPIHPPCEKTGLQYLLIILDYFPRFMIARGFAEADQLVAIIILLENVVPMWLALYGPNSE